MECKYCEDSKFGATCDYRLSYQRMCEFVRLMKFYLRQDNIDMVKKLIECNGNKGSCLFIKKD